jgi:uncharacterized protein HemY
MNEKGDIELNTVVMMVIIFLVLLLIIMWFTGGFGSLTAGFAQIGNVTLNKTINATTYMPG